MSTLNEIVAIFELPVFGWEDCSPPVPTPTSKIWNPQGFKSDQESQDGADSETNLSASQMAICQPMGDITMTPPIFVPVLQNPQS